MALDLSQYKMTDTAKVLDIINNAKQMVTDAVEKVW